jgi:hypothetical protein
MSFKYLMEVNDYFVFLTLPAQMITTQQQSSSMIWQHPVLRRFNCVTCANFFISFISGVLERRKVDNGLSPLLSFAQGVTFRFCCKRLCLWQDEATNKDKAIQLVLSCLEEVQNMSKTEKLEYLRCDY